MGLADEVSRCAVIVDDTVVQRGVPTGEKVLDVVPVGLQFSPTSFERKVDSALVDSESKDPFPVVGHSRDQLRSLDLELVVAEEDPVGLVGFSRKTIGDDDVQVDESVEEDIFP